MKNLKFNQKKRGTLLGIMLALTFVMSTYSQGEGKSLLYSQNEDNSMERYPEVVSEKDALLPVVEIDLPDTPSITYINKLGEVVAVFYGEKAIKEKCNTDGISKSYFVTAYGIHEIYLLPKDYNIKSVLVHNSHAK